MKFYITDYHDKFDPVGTILIYFASLAIIILFSAAIHGCIESNRIQRETEAATKEACKPLLIATHYRDVLTGSLMVVCTDNTVKKVQ